MAGTILGGKQAAKTNKERHGSDFYIELGRKGGLKKVPKGFAINRELAKSAGALGGKRSKRTKAIK